ncbi:MAG: hypothetical protein HC876_11955 [Chloroflexaceae bacterium]|nr:hypothetical protein [Chloroflexaceae bacterium]NJO06165.1 hypothetical protein [Chloroflexaceae bacterium]
MYIIALALAFLVGCSAESPLVPTSVPVVLEGTVIDRYTGEPVPTATVRLGETNLDLADDGSYSISEWTPDDTLEISAPGYEPLLLPLASYSQEPQGSATIIQLNTELRPNVLQGTVSDAESDAPLADVLVEAHLISGTETLDTITTTTNAEGLYRFEDISEQVLLTFTSPDYTVVEQELEQTRQHDVRLRRDVLTGQVTDQYSGEPLAGAEVAIGSLTATTDETGTYRLKGVPEGEQAITIEATGYAAFEQSFDLLETYAVDAVLRPDVLSAVLVDGETGEPVPHATIIATETQTSTAVTSVRIDKQIDGRFTLDNMPEDGYLQVLAPGYRKAVFEIQAGSIPSQIELVPFEARALYVKTTTVAYFTERMELFWDTIERTELNAIVIDLKSDNLADLGLIYYDSQVPIIQELGTSAPIIDMKAVIDEAKRRGIYTIARIHVFAHDNLLAETMPEWAAQDAEGCTPGENRPCNGDVFYADWDIAWLDPYNRNVWDYNIQLGVEAAQMGFDEIQFDYIRFPNDAADIEHMRLSGPFNWREDPEPLYNNIIELLTLAHEAFNNSGAFFSIDIFGYAAWAPAPYIGQRADWMSEHVDYICPMIYPSHFWVNELGFENAAAHPYEIVYESLNFGNKMVQDNRAKLRPWLQDFTLIWVPEPLIVRYGVNEVQAQINATEDSPYGSGWALWDPDNEYTLDALRPETVDNEYIANVRQPESGE